MMPVGNRRSVARRRIMRSGPEPLDSTVTDALRYVLEECLLYPMLLSP
jgi:hypothetical protein